MDLAAIEGQLAEKRKELAVLQRDTIRAKRAKSRPDLRLFVRVAAFSLGLIVGFAAVALEHTHNPIQHDDPGHCQ